MVNTLIEEPPVLYSALLADATFHELKLAATAVARGILAILCASRAGGLGWDRNII